MIIITAYMENTTDNRTIWGRGMMWLAVGFCQLQLLLASRLWSCGLRNLGNVWEIWLPLAVELLCLVIGTCVVVYYPAKGSNEDHSYRVHDHIEHFGQCCRRASFACASNSNILHKAVKIVCKLLVISCMCLNTYVSISGCVCGCGWYIN